MNAGAMPLNSWSAPAAAGSTRRSRAERRRPAPAPQGPRDGERLGRRHEGAGADARPGARPLSPGRETGLERARYLGGGEALQTLKGVRTIFLQPRQGRLNLFAGRALLY